MREASQRLAALPGPRRPGTPGPDMWPDERGSGPDAPTQPLPLSLPLLAPLPLPLLAPLPDPAAPVPRGALPVPHRRQRRRRVPAPDVPAVTQPLPVVPTPSAGPVDRSLVARLGAVVRRFVPAGAVAARLDPGRPGATALALVAAAAALLAAAGVWMERPRAEAVDALPVVSAEPGDAADGDGAAGGPIVVSVVGKVRTPGLVTVPDGARVADAVAAAGGALPGVDLTGVNLARRLADGEQVAVGVAAAGGATSAPSGVPGASRPGAPVDLNTATAAQLDSLPGVGPVTAERIVEWRTRNGSFRRVEQLREVDGIGERRFAQLKALVTVS